MRADFTRIDRQLGPFDFGISLDALYLVAKPVAALARIGLLLRKGAGLFFTLYCSATQVMGARYEPTDWCQFVSEAGFRVVSMRNVSGFWRSQMKKRHRDRLSRSGSLLANDGAIVWPDLKVSQSIIDASESGNDSVDSVSRYEILALRSNRAK